MAEREFIAKEWRDEKGIFHIREVGQELIRCKECKHKHKTDRGIISCDCITYGFNHTDMDFCSYGEREGE